MVIKIYTDGSCRLSKESVNGSYSGFGGWAYACLLEDDDGRVIKSKYRSLGEKDTTNNSMELRAILEGLRALKSTNSIPVIVYTDSRYCIDAITKWVEGWILNKWFTMSGRPVANKELIQAIHKIVKHAPCDITFSWVKGHNGDKYNELVDTLAGEARKIITEQSKNNSNNKQEKNYGKKKTRKGAGANATSSTNVTAEINSNTDTNRESVCKIRKNFNSNKKTR